MDKQAYTVEEVAEILQISTTKLYQLIRDKEVRTFRIGRSIRVSADALMEFMGEPKATVPA